jgi:rhodanese-related sulfurtransferase
MNLHSRLLGTTPEIGTLAAQDLLAAPAAPYLLDVREPQEFVSGHIQGAVLIPIGQLTARLHELPRDRDILCICRSGARSLAATRQLLSAGYRAVNLGGGMLSWADAALPITRGPA